MQELSFCFLGSEDSRAGKGRKVGSDVSHQGFSVLWGHIDLLLRIQNSQAMCKNLAVLMVICLNLF